MLLFTEGFDWTTQVADLTTYGKWLSHNGASIGNSGTQLRFGSGSGNYWTTGGRAGFIRRAIGSNLDAGILGCAVRFDTTVNTYKAAIFVLFDTVSNVQMGLLVNNDGTFSVFRGSDSNILGTSTFAITGNQYHYVEFKWKIANSIGSSDVIVKVDGTTILTLSSATDTQATSNAYATHYQISGINGLASSGSGNFYIDDHYFIDLTGSVNNTFLGIVRVQTLYPNGNGNSSGFTGSDGNSVNNYQQVDETSISTSDYNDGTAVNQKDTYTFTDTNAATSTILGVTINHVSLRTDTDARSVVPVIRHSSTDYDGSSQSLTASAAHFQSVHETNPGTSSGWTKSDVDAAEFGLKVSA